jgi:hypothetical protein
LTDLYLKAVGDHSSLVEKADPIQGDDDDLKWRVAQAERNVKEAQQRFSSHRAAHSST